jgi:phosphoserine aminotransferase
MEPDRILWVQKMSLFHINILFLYIELSHRSPAFAKIIQDAERDIREIL